MTIHCSLHPSKPAHFQCHKCDTAFCGGCIVQRTVPQYGQMQTNYFCPSCNIPAEQLEIGNFIDPFWTRMPKFFTYPLQLQAIAVVVALSLLSAIFPSTLLVLIFGFVVSTKYAYTILTNTAQGNLKAPNASVELFNSDVMQVFKQYVLFAALGGISLFVGKYTGIYGAGLFGLLSFLLMPAMLMVLVSTNSILAALNPMVVVPIVTRIGWRYALMFVFLLLLPAAPATVLYLLPHTIPLGVSMFLATFLQHYYTFIAYNLMGYVLLQYHDEIGFDVDYEYFIKSSQTKKEQEKIPQTPEEILTHQINTMVKVGKHEEALNLIREESRGKENDINLSEKYFNLLKICQKRDSYIKHGPYHLGLLIGQQKKAKAIKVYQEISTDNEIEIPAQSVLTIGKWFFERNEHQNARNCYIGFIKKNPGHAQLPDAYFPLIKLLNEYTGNQKKAAELARGLVKTYPQHALTPKVKNYMQTMMQAAL